MGLSGTLRIVEESWGFSIWKRGKQFGAAVGVPIAEVLANLGAKSWVSVAGKAAGVYCTLS